MAKQTFTTGQVLTAAQMTSLQQTAMLGGAANAKTASYVLVAADAGDSITMSNAGATTITVNTGLFAEGDTVTIINLGAGACTITAGTATVTTSGSLVLAQNQGGVLRFTSTGAAIFFQFATPAGGGLTLLSTTTLSGASTSISIAGTGYNYYQIYINDVDVSGSAELRFYCNATQNNIDYVSAVQIDTGTRFLNGTVNANAKLSDDFLNGTFGDSTFALTIYNAQSTTAPKNFIASSGYFDHLSRRVAMVTSGLIKLDPVIDTIVFVASANTFTGGEVLIYGVK